nr:NTP binding protein [Fijivirus sp.]
MAKFKASITDLVFPLYVKKNKQFNEIIDINKYYQHYYSRQSLRIRHKFMSSFDDSLRKIPSIPGPIEGFSGENLDLMFYRLRCGIMAGMHYPQVVFRTRKKRFGFGVKVENNTKIQTITPGVKFIPLYVEKIKVSEINGDVVYIDEMGEQYAFGPKTSTRLIEKYLKLKGSVPESEKLMHAIIDEFSVGNVVKVIDDDISKYTFEIYDVTSIPTEKIHDKIDQLMRVNFIPLTYTYFLVDSLDVTRDLPSWLIQSFNDMSTIRIPIDPLPIDRANETPINIKVVITNDSMMMTNLFWTYTNLPKNDVITLTPEERKKFIMSQIGSRSELNSIPYFAHPSYTYTVTIGDPVNTFMNTRQNDILRANVIQSLEGEIPLFVVGNKGTGKTSLIKEFNDHNICAIDSDLFGRLVNHILKSTDMSLDELAEENMSLDRLYDYFIEVVGGNETVSIFETLMDAHIKDMTRPERITKNRVCDMTPFRYHLELFHSHYNAIMDHKAIGYIPFLQCVYAYYKASGMKALIVFCHSETELSRIPTKYNSIVIFSPIDYFTYLSKRDNPQVELFLHYVYSTNRVLAMRICTLEFRRWCNLPIVLFK